MSDAAINDFIQTMGLLWQSEGGPRIAGQVLAYLIVAGEPRSLQQMCEALHISKASASTNARLLEGKGCLRRVRPLGARQDAWLAVPNPSLSLLRSVAQRFRNNAETVGHLAAGFPPEMAAARGRVEDFADFYRKSADFMDEWTARLGQDGPPVPGGADRDEH
ncbi:GbsR/MarR family transcriptional regulator [Pseudooceanicola sp. 200-1SW]|uniref:GbsR/MarR family transcriptional regulator n=1 Tax=Pseudooceanicola sp. 200-1SW TaxID=3425949 RepID=UPI003D7F6DB9